MILASPWITTLSSKKIKIEERDSSSYVVKGSKINGIAYCMYELTSSKYGQRRCECLDMYKELIPYEEAWSWQKSIVQKRKTLEIKGEDHSDTLIVLQHPPVYTLGVASSKGYLNFDVKEAPCDIYRVDRDGEVTYHGPRQVIDEFLSLLRQRNERERMKYPFCFFGCHAFKEIFDNEHKEVGDNSKLIRKLGRMLKGLNRNIFYVFFPIRTGSHFCLVYVNFPNCVWRFYNPLSDKSQLYTHHRVAADKFTKVMNVVMTHTLGWMGCFDWKMTQIVKALWQENSKD